MPIKGLSDKRRYPRGGKIRLGEKRKVEKNGKTIEFPAKLDYFLFDPEDETMLPLLHKQYGDKPDKLLVYFASDNLEEVFPQYYKCYGASGLLCKGDGVTANRTADGGALVECECPAPDNCDFAMERGKNGKPGCKQLASLQFFLKGWDKFYVWQIDTTSYHSILNVNSALEIMRSVTGHIGWIPIELHLKPQQIQPDGKKQVAYVLDLVLPCSPEEAIKLRPMIAGKQNAELPPLLEHDAPDDLYPASQITVDEDGVVHEGKTEILRKIASEAGVPVFDASSRTPVLPATAISEPDPVDDTANIPFDDDAPAQHDYSQVPKQDKRAEQPAKPVTPLKTVAPLKQPEPPRDLANHPDVVALQDKLSPTAFRVMTQQAVKEKWTLEQLLTAMRGRIKQVEESVL